MELFVTVLVLAIGFLAIIAWGRNKDAKEANDVAYAHLVRRQKVEDELRRLKKQLKDLAA